MTVLPAAFAAVSSSGVRASDGMIARFAGGKAVASTAEMPASRYTADADAPTAMAPPAAPTVAARARSEASMTCSRR